MQDNKNRGIKEQEKDSDIPVGVISLLFLLFFPLAVLFLSGVSLLADKQTPGKEPGDKSNE